MKKQIAELSLLLLCAAALLAMPASSRAQANANPPVAPPPVTPVTPPAVTPPPATTPPAAAPKPAAKKAKPATKPAATTFHGTVAALDTNAMTLTVEKRTFEITSETVITKNDKPAILSDGTVGEAVRGAFKKGEGGKLDATAIHFGGATKPAKKESTGN